MEYKHIIWSESKNFDGNITTWLGKINDRTIYTICQFNNKMFTDSYIMTSTIVPIDMMKGDDLDELQDAAQVLLEAFIKSFYLL